MLVSSANIIGSSTEDAFLRSLTYNKNNSGPKMEPCGTPVNGSNPCVIPISYTI